MGTLFLSIECLFAEFPVTRSISWENLLQEIKDIHAHFSRVIRSQLPSEHERNNFACAFRFVFQAEQAPIVIELSPIHIITNKPPLVQEINLRELGYQIILAGRRSFVFLSHAPIQVVYDSLAALHHNFLQKVSRDNAAARNQAMLLRERDR